MSARPPIRLRICPVKRATVNITSEKTVLRTSCLGCSMSIAKLSPSHMPILAFTASMTTTRLVCAATRKPRNSRKGSRRNAPPYLSWMKKISRPLIVPAIMAPARAPGSHIRCSGMVGMRITSV